MRNFHYSLFWFLLICIYCKESKSPEKVAIPANSNQILDPLTYYIVTQNGQNLRSEPSINSKIITVIPYATRIDKISQRQPFIDLNGESGRWIRIQYENKIGWLFTGLMIANEFPYQKAYFSRLLGEKCDTDMEASKCFRIIESQLLSGDSKNVNVSRDKFDLKLTFESGITITLRDSFQKDNFRKYSFLGKIRHILIVHESYWEGGYTFGFDLRSGARFRLDDEPIFSPDGQHFLTVQACAVNYFCDSGLKIYRVSEKSTNFSKTLTTEPVLKAIWLSDKKIEAILFPYSDEGPRNIKLFALK